MDKWKEAQDFQTSVTVIVVSYKPVLEKLLLTVESILLQKNILVQIIVCDDGSEVTYFDELNNLFRQYDFTNYVLVHNKKNNGTVLNFCSALPYVQGEYIKGISPGDYFYDSFVLNNWTVFMKEIGCVASFGDAIYYEYNNFSHFIRERACPGLIKPYVKRNFEEIKRNYLLFNDLILGAVTLIKADSFIKYINLIKGKVVYAEDHIFRIMIAENKKIFYFPQKVLFYEYGGGISTTNNLEIRNLLDLDWDEANKIIQSRLKEKNLSNFKRINEYRKHKFSFIYRVRFNFSVKGKVMHDMKRKLVGRKTPIKIDKDSIFYILHGVR